MTDFSRIANLPPYFFSVIGELKVLARRRGEDVIDLSMGNPDGPTPSHIVRKLIEVVQRPGTHRYSTSKGIPRLRRAICNWYHRRFNVELNCDNQATVTIGSKEGIGHLCLAMLDRDDIVLVPNPSYPIHIYGPVIGGASVFPVAISENVDFLLELERVVRSVYPRPKLLILNFPSNPTTQCADLPFFEKVIALAREYRFWVVNDLAYADIVFDGYRAPSILQVPGAIEVAAEFFTLSKSYNMPGWRIGFMAGNSKLVGALTRLKSYFDYGTFTPIQVAAIAALEGPQNCVQEICETYGQRRNALVNGLRSLNWELRLPSATMFVWAPIPEPFRYLGSFEFSKLMLTHAKVAVSPGIGFGEFGDDHVRFALIENEERIRQAIRNIKKMFQIPPQLLSERSSTSDANPLHL